MMFTITHQNGSRHTTALSKSDAIGFLNSDDFIAAGRCHIDTAGFRKDVYPQMFDDNGNVKTGHFDYDWYIV